MVKVKKMSLSKKLKLIVKGSEKPTYGTDPNDPWSARAGITESHGMLDAFLKARGINPNFISRETKIAHAKSAEFAKWKQDHFNTEEVDKKDMVCMDIPLLIRVLEFTREDMKSDIELHNMVERLINMRNNVPLDMSHYDAITQKLVKENEEELEEGAFKRIATDREEDARLKKMSALDKFRADAVAREKKHSDIEKNSGGMTSAIDRLEKHLNKEESEQIDELKKSTVKSWLGQQSVVPPKKEGMDKKAHNQRIKTRSKSWDRALDRLSGRKPTSEDVYQDAQSATQTPCDCGTTPDQTEPIYSRKKQMSKSARIIKSIYKKKGIKEDLYDSEKEDKSVATYGKKPKMKELDNTFGDDDNQAAAVLSGGKTLTGQTRDTLEIDPVMKRPGKPDAKK
jgi:hypothetical protein